jgi:hypothetical protein
MPQMRTPQLPGYYSEQEQAERLGLVISSLRRWRRLGIGPASVRIGRRTVYKYGGDEKWLAEQQAKAECEQSQSGKGQGGEIRRGRPRKNRTTPRRRTR